LSEQRKAVGVVLVHPETPGLVDGDLYYSQILPLIIQKAHEILPNTGAWHIRQLERTKIYAHGDVIQVAIAFEVTEDAKVGTSSDE
jgi:hypothetical protein